MAQSKGQARLEFRTGTELKNEMQQAADNLGVSLSSFVIQSAVEKARLVNQQANTVKLCDVDRDVFLSLLDSPPAPNDKLVKLLANG